MKFIIELSLALAFTLCFLNVQANEPGPVQLRIKNNSNITIKKLVIINSGSDSFVFRNVKAHKISKRQTLSSLCSCSYTVLITYCRGNHNETTVRTSCTNIMECHDFYAGKMLLNISTTKLPKDLKHFDSSNADTDISFKKG